MMEKPSMTPNHAGASERLYQLALEYSKILRQLLGDELISVVLYGSVARGSAAARSDIDLVIIVKNLPAGQLKRKEILDGADKEIDPVLEGLRRDGIEASFSRILKTPDEASSVTPLYLDFVEDAILLFDRDGFFDSILSRLRQNLRSLGSRRVSTGRILYWDLKPDYKAGERFSL
jgi:predicted nucleotidyltransferase